LENNALCVAKICRRSPDEKQILKLKEKAKVCDFCDVRKANAGSLPNGRTKIFDLNGRSFVEHPNRSIINESK
jgi:hypothetical protein